MAIRRYQFEGFSLDPVERRLFAGEATVELNSRYFDALLLLLRHPGTLLSKERFLAEVWQGIPVTDAVLTQCIKTLRRQLGDSATQPHLIETVPKHGYRFIAAVSCVTDGDVAPEHMTLGPAPWAAPVPRAHDWARVRLTLGAGVTGGGLAGLLGGVTFGFAAAAQSQQNGIGALSTLLVLAALATLLALVGAAGVVGGIAAARLVARDFGFAGLVGGAAGGLLVGAFGKLIGNDAFVLLFGHAPGDITGALEGLLLGAAVGLADDLALRSSADGSVRRNVLLAPGIGAAAGLLITATGGKLLSGSLALLAGSFPDARLHFDPLGAVLGPVAAAGTNALEGAWFSLCVAGALILARR
ncbi:MAG TPA: winged helix-turn-helix domain-containing protein [Gammaproteobacteria bacterium]|nr:winged helix-turn-helix domain-containing protein [Gammaproteobacteria bacterium]